MDPIILLETLGSLDRIIVLVRDSATQEPIPGAHVIISSEAIDPDQEQKTGVDSRTTFDGLPAGHYVIQIQAEGYHDGGTERELAAGEGSEFLLELSGRFHAPKSYTLPVRFATFIYLRPLRTWYIGGGGQIIHQNEFVGAAGVP